MSVRLETTYPGTRWENTRMVDTKDSRPDPAVSECMAQMYFGPVKTTSDKIGRVALWAGTGAGIGAGAGIIAPAVGPPVGAVVVGGIFAGIGFCTIL